MAVGCYVIGERIIHLSLEISETICYASQGCITHFIDACKKLPGKLECLVIVEPEFVQPKILKELFKVGQEYANFVYIIPAIGALLQYTVSVIKHFFMNNILILLKSYEQYYACSLMKENNMIYPFCIKTETIESLQHEFYSGFPLKDVHCIHRSHMKEKARNRFKCRFPTANFHRIHPPMIILALGGFYKAMCIAEPGKHLEVANFTPGIFHGNVTIVKRCATFPLKINFMPLVDYPTIFRDTLAVSTRRKTWVIREVEILLPRQHWVKNFVIEYNEFGLLNVEDPSTQLSFSIFNDFSFNSNKVHVWSITKQSRAIFDIAKNERQLVPFDDKVKNLFSDEWLNNVDQTTTDLPTLNSNLHTIFVDKKFNNYMNGPIISIVPSYIGILQYYVTYFKPTTPNVIIIVATKSHSKFYALCQRSPLCYTVTYISDYSEAQTIFNSASAKKKIRILFIYEKGMNQSLSLDFFSINISVSRFELLNYEEVMFYGGANYALHNSSSTLVSQYVTIDPLLDPEENDCKGLSTVSQRTSTCFYEIEAFFHFALKSINSKLFYCDLIAILLERQQNIHIYFFVHVEKKFLFKFDITVSGSVIIDAALLHYADLVITANSEISKIAKDVSITLLEWNNATGVNVFLSDMKDEKLLIYDAPNYTQAIHSANNNDVLASVIFEKTSMTVQLKSDKCRIISENEQYILIKDEDWIPMYISFSQTVPLFGKDAFEDLENSPISVIYDFVKLIGVTSKTLSSFDPKWKFELIEMNDSDDPKLGFKVHTSHGLKIITPEIAMALYLQKLINVYEKHIGKNVDEIKVELLDTVLTDIQKESFTNAAKRSKKFVVFC